MKTNRPLSTQDYKTFYIWEFSHGFQTDAGKGVFNTLEEVKSFVDQVSQQSNVHFIYQG